MTPWLAAGSSEPPIASDDPEFEAKAADIIGLYLQLPLNVAVFCVDEQTAIQALDRLDPVLPRSPGRAASHGFEYFRHGTLSQYAGLETQTGVVLCKTATRHTSSEFVVFLREIVASQKTDKEIHVIVENSLARETKLVSKFLVEYLNVQLHFTATYFSWLNPVENWFSQIQRSVSARGVFTSIANLRIKLMRYIRHYNKTATPIRWTYSDASKRIKA